MQIKAFDVANQLRPVNRLLKRMEVAMSRYSVSRRSALGGFLVPFATLMTGVFYPVRKGVIASFKRLAGRTDTVRAANRPARSLAPTDVLPKLALLPAYLPKGYRFSSARKGSKRAFGGGDGAITMRFRNPKFDGYALTVLTNDKPATTTFDATRAIMPTHVELRRPNGPVLNAEYYDSWCDMTRTGPLFNSNLHSLVFSLGGMRVAVLGEKAAAVDRDELIKVAEHLQSPTDAAELTGLKVEAL